MTIPCVREIMHSSGLPGAADFDCDTLAGGPPAMVAADASLLDVARLLSRQRVTCAIVLHDGQQIGWLSARDIVQALASYARQMVASYLPTGSAASALGR
jgi:CBS domain-containing protein